MRGKARFWLLLVLAAGVLAGACGGDDDGPPPEDADPPTLLIEEGNASGFGGCNTFTGGYELDGDSISIGPLAGTLMACELQKMAVEGAYMPALEAADAWSIDGDELVLSSGGEETLRFSSS